MAVVIENRINKDKATFLATCQGTGGDCTLLEIELEPGGGNELHYHKTFTERFEAIEGVVSLGLSGGRTLLLQPGESYTVEKKALHYFKNETEQTIRFFVELKPGNVGFERMLQIAYGMTHDGSVNEKGIPKSLYHLGVILKLGDSYPAGFFMKLLVPIFLWMGRWAARKGIEQKLIDKYCVNLEEHNAAEP